jgi:hypothetical protein
MELNKKAWSILSEEEKTCLNLSINLKKSSWEAGEIMNKSHYKYLEIKYRAEYFLKLFTEHFNKYDTLIPNSVSDLYTNIHFDNFFTRLISERLRIGDLKESLKGTFYSDSSRRNIDIEEILIKLKEESIKSNKKDVADTYFIITEYDRWNNFRILNKELQLPSAYKRRNKVRDSKHLDVLLGFPKVIRRFILKSNYNGKEDIYWSFIINRDRDKNNFIPIKIKQSDKDSYHKLTQLMIPIFKTEEDCRKFAFLILSFPKKGVRDCKIGLKFWPKFRVYIKNALNYNDINMINPAQSNLLMIEPDTDRALVRRYESKEK